jgi:hypothetical protein
MYSATVVLWTGVQSESLRETFDSYTQASVWVYEQKRVYGRAVVSAFVL